MDTNITSDGTITTDFQRLVYGKSPEERMALLTNEEMAKIMKQTENDPRIMDLIGKSHEQPLFIDDPVNHPSHYCQGGIETITVIEAWGLDYCLGNTVKYISRAGKKDPQKTVEDLEKARWYLDREIAKLKAGMTISVQEERE